MDELNKAEIEELDAAIDKYKNVDTKTLSELSHDSAWYEAWDKSKHPTPILAVWTISATFAPC